MIDALLTRLKDGIEIRQTLSKIRQAIKDEEILAICIISCGIKQIF